MNYFVNIFPTKEWHGRAVFHIDQLLCYCYFLCSVKLSHWIVIYYLYVILEMLRYCEVRAIHRRMDFNKRRIKKHRVKNSFVKCCYIHIAKCLQCMWAYFYTWIYLNASFWFEVFFLKHTNNFLTHPFTLSLQVRLMSVPRY